MCTKDINLNDVEFGDEIFVSRDGINWIKERYYDIGNNGVVIRDEYGDLWVYRYAKDIVPKRESNNGKDKF